MTKAEYQAVIAEYEAIAGEGFKGYQEPLYVSIARCNLALIELGEAVVKGCSPILKAVNDLIQR